MTDVDYGEGRSHAAEGRPRKRRSVASTFGMGCLGFLALFLTIGTLWYAGTGRYIPYVPLPPPPPVPNGFNDYVMASRMLRANGGTNAMYQPGFTDTIVSLAAEQQVVAKNQKVLALLRQALGKECLVPPSRSVTELYPYLADVKGLARLLVGVADVKAAKGDYAGAFDAGLDSVRMGQDMVRGGVIIHGLVAIAIQSIAQNSMLEYIDKLSATDCDRLAARLESLLKARVPYGQIIREESYFSLSSLSKMKGSDTAFVINPNAGMDGEEVPGWQKFAGTIYWHSQRDHALHELEDYYKAMLVEEQKPFALRKSVPTPKSPVASMVAPVFDQAHMSFDGMEVHSRLLLLALKIRSYHLKHGLLPTSLKDLGVDPTVVADPFTGKPMMYQPKGSDYLLFSVGPDLKDDGGVPADERPVNGLPQGDIGIRRFMLPQGSQSSKNYYRRVPHMKSPLLPSGAPPLHP